MYYTWDGISLLAFLSDEEYKNVKSIMEKGSQGTATADEIDYARKLIRINESHFGHMTAEEYKRTVAEMKKMETCQKIFSRCN